MKSKLQSNPLFLWLWLLGFLVVPLIVFYLLMGEINLSKQNWIIATNQSTPIIHYPGSQDNFHTVWTQWVQSQVPTIYQPYFTSIEVAAAHDYYVNGFLTINKVIYPMGHNFIQNYPFAHVNLHAIYIFLLTLAAHLLFLLGYHLITFKLNKPWLLSSESYAFLIAFWSAIVILYFSGAFPWFGTEHPTNVVWYVITIRIILILLGGFVSFYLPFKAHLFFQRRFFPLYYMEEVSQIRKEDLEFKKKNPGISRIKNKRTSIKLGK